MAQTVGYFGDIDKRRQFTAKSDSRSASKTFLYVFSWHADDIRMALEVH